jgi:hypothetical protein
MSGGKYTARNESLTSPRGMIAHGNIMSEGIDSLFAHLARNKFLVLRNHRENHFFEGVDLEMVPIPSSPEVLI